MIKAYSNIVKTIFFENNSITKNIFLQLNLLSRILVYYQYTASFDTIIVNTVYTRMLAEEFWKKICKKLGEAHVPQ